MHDGATAALKARLGGAGGIIQEGEEGFSGTNLCYRFILSDEVEEIGIDEFVGVHDCQKLRLRSVGVLPKVGDLLNLLGVLKTQIFRSRILSASNSFSSCFRSGVELSNAASSKHTPHSPKPQLEQKSKWIVFGNAQGEAGN